MSTGLVIQVPEYLTTGEKNPHSYRRVPLYGPRGLILSDAPTAKRQPLAVLLFGDDMPRCRVIFIQHGSRI